MKRKSTPYLKDVLFLYCFSIDWYYFFTVLAKLL